MRCCYAPPCTSAATFWPRPERLYEEISADYSDMVYAGGTKGIEARRNSFIPRWSLKCCAIAGSLEEAGDWWFTFHSVAGQPWRTELKMTCPCIKSQIRRNYQNEKATA